VSPNSMWLVDSVQQQPPMMPCALSGLCRVASNCKSDRWALGKRLCKRSLGSPSPRWTKANPENAPHQAGTERMAFAVAQHPQEMLVLGDRERSKAPLPDGAVPWLCRMWLGQ
jgi:hypothetical protein